MTRAQVSIAQLEEIGSVSILEITSPYEHNPDLNFIP
jgi:hypothetical protein